MRLPHATCRIDKIHVEEGKLLNVEDIEDVLRVLKIKTIKFTRECSRHGFLLPKNIT